ncbi:FAD-binding protein [Nocardia sp. NPDC059240]|uniref:FAD-dependent oxidoreductase n=1 Tax=Nocardia sp. NPDC059240 TaxID=3346786 RepID=UPI00368AACF3
MKSQTGRSISRGTFLRGALGIAVAGAGLAGASRLAVFDQAASAAGAERKPPIAPARTASDGPDWTGLQGKLRGRVIMPADPRYAQTKEVFNTRFDDQTPTAVVQVADAEDVATAFAFAADNNLQVAARAGGHSYAGLSTATGTLVVDVRGLRGVVAADGRAVVAPGHTLYEVYQELDKTGQSLPTGMCPSVGVAGLTLGGGYGSDARAHGLTCDRLTAATLVLPDGTITEASAATRPDLFWALRGGGPLFGIVTSMTFDTIPALTKDVVRLTFSGDDAEQVINGWQQWLRDAPREQWADVSIDANGEGGLHCWMQLVCPEGTSDTVAATLVEAIDVAPIATDPRTLTHLDTVLYLAGGTADQPRAAFTNGSDIVSTLTPDTVGRIVDAVTRFSSVGGTGWVQINTLDGAVRDLSPTATAYPWRNHAAMVEWGAYEPIPHSAALDYLADAHNALTPESVGAYINYLEPGDPISRYYGPNHTRLAALRARVDPDDRIRTVLNT